MVMMEDERMEKERAVIFRDTRQYYCDYFPSQATLCGYSREQGRELHEGKLFKCQIENCNREFVYPINLKRRHVRDLHDEKQYVFQEPGCADTNQSCESTRILMLHEGKLFKCQIENCNREFVYPSNLKRRHVRDLHDEKQYVFQEPGCADTNQSCESTRILMLLALASEVGSITVFPNHMAHGEGQEEQDN
uniref:C2H2-type domain-containing protein n=1 Tax=Salix viminalis TaxID=40686 RepID=A0A6N2MAI3_SALVM